MARDTVKSAELLKWATTVKASLEKARLPFEGLWGDIRRNFEPTLGKALSQGRDLNEEAAKRDDEAILNSKTRDVVGRLASGLQSGITNQARQWFRLVPKGAPSDERLSSGVRCIPAAGLGRIIMEMRKGTAEGGVLPIGAGTAGLG